MEQVAAGLNELTAQLNQTRPAQPAQPAQPAKSLNVNSNASVNSNQTGRQERPNRFAGDLSVAPPAATQNTLSPVKTPSRNTGTSRWPRPQQPSPKPRDTGAGGNDLSPLASTTQRSDISPLPTNPVAGPSITDLLQTENIRLRMELAEEQRRGMRATRGTDQQTDAQLRIEMAILRSSLRTQWALSDQEIGMKAGQLPLTVRYFTSQFFRAGARSLGAPAHAEFLSYFDGVGPGGNARWEDYIQDVNLRSRIMQVFVWQFLLKNVFGRFLWLGDLAVEAQRVSAPLDPGKSLMMNGVNWNPFSFFAKKHKFTIAPSLPHAHKHIVIQGSDSLREFQQYQRWVCLMADIYSDNSGILDFQRARPELKGQWASRYWQEFHRITSPFSSGEADVERQETEFKDLLDEAIALDLEMSRGTLARLKFRYPNNLIGTKYDTAGLPYNLTREEKVGDIIGHEITMIVAPAFYRQGTSMGDDYDQDDVELTVPTVSCAVPAPIPPQASPSRASREEPVRRRRRDEPREQDSVARQDEHEDGSGLSTQEPAQSRGEGYAFGVRNLPWGRALQLVPALILTFFLAFVKF